MSALRNVPFAENLLESELLVVLAFAVAQCIYLAAAGHISGIDRFPSVFVSVLVFVVYSCLGLILTGIAVRRLFAVKPGLQLLRDTQ